jgi:hypothetical protein
MDDGTATVDGIAAFYGWLPEPTVTASAYPQPIRILSWDVPACRAGGVTDDPRTAARHVAAELKAAPVGAVGTG